MDGRLRVASILAVALVPAVSLVACGGPQDPADEGETCYRDADCKYGLVCVPRQNERACSKDIGGLVSQVERPPPPPDAGEPPADGG